jgi:hypothetical protein
MRVVKRRFHPLFAALACMAVTACASAGDVRGGVHVDGIVWQPDAATTRPTGAWDRLGAHRLIVQWQVVDGQAFVGGTGYPVVEPATDWTRIAREPWAGTVIMGLAGRFSEPEARRDVAQLVESSRRLAEVKSPLNVVGWYFPVEADPTWNDAARMGALLAELPRPLWVSAYDKGNIGPVAFASWLQSWVPADVGVLFQDGVGEHVRGAPVARRYADEMATRLGANRTAVIAEAFRPRVGGGFRPATADELRRQTKAYRGLTVYLFDGPHYVSEQVVDDLAGGRP